MTAAGLDVGTSGVKATIFSEDMRVLSHAYREYPTLMPSPGMYELDPETVFSAVLEVLAEAVAVSGQRTLEAVCITSFGESFTCLDSEDKPLNNFMLYIDTRGGDACRAFGESMSECELYAVTGHYIDPMFSMFKLRHIFDADPALAPRVRKLCFVADYVAYRLGAEHVCEYSLASRSCMLDIRAKKWWTPGVEFSGLNADALPGLIPVGGEAGRMSAELAEKLNIDFRPLLMLGGHDQICAAAGSGAFDVGEAANGMGTVDCMTLLLGGGVDTDRMVADRLTMVPYITYGVYAAYAVNYTGGSTVQWFRNTLAGELRSQGDSYDRLNAEAPAEPTDILVIPDFSEGGIPATISGMTLSTTRGELFRAFLEGESMEMKLRLDILDSAGAHAQRIITVGGGAKSPLWMQLRADIFGREITVPRISEAGTLACAMICFVRLGVYPDLRAAAAAASGESASYRPSSNEGVYAKKYKKYLGLRRGLEGASDV